MSFRRRGNLYTDDSFCSITKQTEAQPYFFDCSITAHFYFIQGIAADPRGGVLIAADTTRVVRIDGGGIMNTIAGSPYRGFSGDGGPAIAASFDLSWWLFSNNREASYGGVAIDGQGAVYIAQTGHNRIRKIDANGIVRTIAGTGVAGFLGDGGPATAAQMQRPSGIALAKDGTLFVAEPVNHRIRKIDPNGTITTFAGDGVPPSSNGSGGALDSKRLNWPQYIAVDGKGNVFVSDPPANLVRKITPGGIISVFAGGNPAGFSGDGGPALAARLSNPGPLAVDPEGNLLIADRWNRRVRVVRADGTIQTLAGGGNGALSFDSGPAVETALDTVSGLSAGNGKIYIAESNLVFRVRSIDSAGQISLVAGAIRLQGLTVPLLLHALMAGISPLIRPATSTLCRATKLTKSMPLVG